MSFGYKDKSVREYIKVLLVFHWNLFVYASL